MSKLLNKPFRAFVLYALLILAGSIPAYYYLLDSLLMRDIDMHNELVRKRIQNSLLRLPTTDPGFSKALENWKRIQPGFELIPAEPGETKSKTYYTVARRLSGVSGVKTFRFRGLSTYIEIHGKPYRLRIESNASQTYRTLRAIALLSLGFFLILATGFILLNRITSRKIWQPFTKNLDEMQRFDLQHPEQLNLNDAGIEEFAALNSVLKKLIANNITAYQRQKEFTENASHELQTPLSLIKAKLDLLLQDKTLSESQLELISSLDIPLSKVSRINKNLLLLAKIENRQFQETENLNLSELLSNTLDLLSELAETKNRKLIRQIEAEVRVRANPYLWEILLSNLLINAFRYSEGSGPIEVTLSAHHLRITNPGLEKLNEETLFARFLPAAEKLNSSGLGLAIVKQICSSQGWEIRYYFQDQRHHFSLSF